MASGILIAPLNSTCKALPVGLKPRSYGSTVCALNRTYAPHHAGPMYSPTILATPPGRNMHKPSATLLIIDDDDVVRASLAAYLDDSGFRVLQAANGPQGMELFESEQPDLVICDLRMPQMDGLELIRQISERQIDLPVIVVSGAGVMSDAVEALRLGRRLSDQAARRSGDARTLGPPRAGSLSSAPGESSLSGATGDRQPRPAGQPASLAGRSGRRARFR